MALLSLAAGGIEGSDAGSSLPPSYTILAKVIVSSQLHSVLFPRCFYTPRPKLTRNCSFPVRHRPHLSLSLLPATTQPNSCAVLRGHGCREVCSVTHLSQSQYHSDWASHTNKTGRKLHPVTTSAAPQSEALQGTGRLSRSFLLTL